MCTALCSLFVQRGVAQAPRWKGEGNGEGAGEGQGAHAGGGMQYISNLSI